MQRAEQRSNPARWFSTMLMARASAAFWPASKSASSVAVRCGIGRGGAVTSESARFGLVVLVANVADELLEQILEGNQ